MNESTASPSQPSRRASSPAPSSRLPSPPLPDRPLEDLILDEDTMPSTPYTPRRAMRGDARGEHLWMRRGRLSAWPHVALAFLYQTAVAGAAFAAVAWLAAAPFGRHAAGVASFGAFAATGPAIAYLTFRDRWRCVEAFASRFCACVAVARIGMLYIPFLALGYANVRAVLKLTGR